MGPSIGLFSSPATACVDNVHQDFDCGFSQEFLLLKF